MRKLLLALILFTSCQVQDSKTLPAPVSKKTANTEKGQEIAIVKPSSSKSTISEESKEPLKMHSKKSVKSKNAAELIINAEKDQHNKQTITEIITTPPAENENSGGANYEEGYIPFIKQYW
jgi:hypothetical protein